MLKRILNDVYVLSGIKLHESYGTNFVLFFIHIID